MISGGSHIPISKTSRNIDNWLQVITHDDKLMINGWLPVVFVHASPSSYPEGITNGEIPSRASSTIQARLKLRPLHMSLGCGDFAWKKMAKSWGKCWENGEKNVGNSATHKNMGDISLNLILVGYVYGDIWWIMAIPGNGPFHVISEL